jgi:hypothetical protein
MTIEATRWVLLEARLEEWNVPFELVADFELKDIKSKDYSQVRTPEHRAPKESVEQYALQMANGAMFPPIVLAANDKALIDGNTRVAAARKNGYKTFPVYLVKPADAAMARVIGSALNQSGGLRLSGDELEEAAAAFLERGFSDAEIARCLGRTAEWARKYRKRAEFDERAGSHPTAATLKPTVKERLADIDHDAPFLAALDAAQDVRMDTATAAKMVEAVREARSDQAATEAVRKVAAAQRPLDQARAVTSPPSGRRSSGLRRAVSDCAKHVELDRKLTETLRTVDVPLVEPAATEYRQVLGQVTASTTALQAAVAELMDRLPVAGNAA